jgi:hypothetical protein
MQRTTAATAAIAGALLIAPFPGAGQEHDAHAHHHGAVPAACSTLVAPPWEGLSRSDLDQIRRVEASLANLSTPEAAARAGFVPRFGNIPTMGVHWVSARRMQAGIRVDEPDHLLFAPIGGRDELVGVAYAFRGPRDATLPPTYESELAAWHDHQELGGPEETLHMLHVWRVPSPYGPFAGNNFFLPFLSRGMATPQACWFGTDADVERLELVATAFALFELLTSDPQPGSQAVVGTFPATLREQIGRSAPRFERWATELDRAARSDDRTAWMEAADRTLSGLGPLERQVVERLRDRIKGIQIPSGARPGS